MTLFEEHTKEEHAQSLANYLPNGFAWMSKNIPTSNLRKFLTGLGCELQRVEQKMNEIAYEHDINTTTLYIEEWESALGIPDDCIPVANTIEERRANLLLKLFLPSVHTSADYEALAAILGITAVVNGGAEFGVFPMTFPIILFPDAKTARFTIVIDFYGVSEDATFPMTFPFVFGNTEISILRCLYEKIKPANCQIIYRYN